MKHLNHFIISCQKSSTHIIVFLSIVCVLALSGCSTSNSNSTVSDKRVQQTKLVITDSKCQKKQDNQTNGNVSINGCSKVKDGYGIPGAYLKDKNYTGKNWSLGDAERGKGIFTSEDCKGLGGYSNESDQYSRENYSIAARWEYMTYDVTPNLYPGWSKHGSSDGTQHWHDEDVEQHEWTKKQKVLIYCPKTNKSVICTPGDGSNCNWGGSPLAAMAGLSYKAQEALGLSVSQCLDENLEMEMWWVNDEEATPGPSTISMDGASGSSDSVSSSTASELGQATDAGADSNPNSTVTGGNSSSGTQIKLPEELKDKQLNDADFYDIPYSEENLAYNQGKVHDMWVQAGSKNDCGLPTYNGRYGVVISNQLAAAGDYIDIVYTDGNVLKCFVVDEKSDQDGGYVLNGTTWGGPKRR